MSIMPSIPTFISLISLIPINTYQDVNARAIEIALVFFRFNVSKMHTLN